jgi:hypothetical protein
MTMSPEVKATFDLEFADLLRAHLWHVRRQRGVLVVYVILLFALLTTVIPAIVAGRERASDPRFVGSTGRRLSWFR